MLLRWGTVLSVLVAGLVASVPALAAERPGANDPLAFLFPSLDAKAEFQLRSSNGYWIEVKGEGRRVVLDVRGSFTGTASYEVPGRASPRRIEARFGNRGRVSVEFRPSGSVIRRVPPSRCKGKPKVTRFGTFVGTINFVGEGRYTEAHAVRARGLSRVSPAWKCKPRHREPPEFRIESKNPVEATAIGAESRRSGIAFSVLTFRPPEEQGLTLFYAESSERHGRMRVHRRLITAGPERTFTFDETLTTATVKPPKPFEGEGIFRRGPKGSVRWSGSLRVSLPGREDIALTGSHFKARLIQPETQAQAGRALAAWHR
jgi:hypothetical protein